MEGEVLRAAAGERLSACAKTTAVSVKTLVVSFLGLSLECDPDIIGTGGGLSLPFHC